MSDEKPESTENGPARDPEGSVTTTETTPTKAEAAALQMSAKPKPDEPKRDGKPAHGDAGHAHDEHADHGLAHTMPLPLLFGVLAALLVLTIATVSVTAIDLGAQGNLIVAMIIATIKAALVCTFFMHLLWDKKFHTVLFLTSVLFLILFLSMTSTDRGEYQHLVDEYRAQQLGVK
jgi:cytochrome c oxidase subunit 4